MNKYPGQKCSMCGSEFDDDEHKLGLVRPFIAGSWEEVKNSSYPAIWFCHSCVVKAGLVIEAEEIVNPGALNRWAQQNPEKIISPKIIDDDC